MRIRRSSFFALLTLLAGSALVPAWAADADGVIGDHSSDIRPQGRGNATKFVINSAGTAAAPATDGILYHGGAVQADGVTASTVNVYYIWYGTWTATQQKILTTLASSIGGSPYFNINSTYNDANGPVHNSVTYKGSATVSSTLYGTSLNDADVLDIVVGTIAAGTLPTDPNGIYFVLTSGGIAEQSGFLSTYCGWHNYSTVNSKVLKYAFVGDPTAGLSACAEQTGVSPNGDVGVDAMASVIAHELSEAVNDPQLNAWYDSSGNESSDKCAWTFGTTHALSSGALYNVTLGGLNFLLQQNWVNAGGGGCAMSYTGAAAPSMNLSVSPATQTVAAGNATGSYTVAAKAVGNVTGTLAYSVSGLPSGATATVSGSAITIATTNATVAGTYVFTITGTDGKATATTTATLVVTAPTLTMTIAPASATLKRPTTGSASTTYTVTVAGSGTVTLAASGSTTGITVSLNKTSITGSGTATLTAAVTSSAKAATNTLTVKATDGVTTKSVTATLVTQ